MAAVDRIRTRRRWKQATNVARYAVYATVAVAVVLALLDVPRWAEWLTVGVALALTVAGYGCVWMYGRALRRETRTRVPDLGDIARHFDSRAES